MSQVCAAATAQIVFAARDLSPAQFCARWPRPFLVSDPTPGCRRASSDPFESTDDDEPGDEISIGAIVPLESDDSHVVSVGRGRAADVKIDYLAVSRLHALFREADGRWFLTDTSSRNGTRLRGVEVPPGAVREVCDGDSVSFGRLAFRFVAPRTLYDLLRGVEAPARAAEVEG
jgi:hypothetical protein